MGKDSAKTPEQSRAEWLIQENKWLNKQPWRPLNGHVEAVAHVIMGRKIPSDCLQVLESTTKGSAVFDMTSMWNLLVEKKEGIEHLTLPYKTTLSELIADNFDKDLERDVCWAYVCPDDDIGEVKSQLLQDAAEIMGRSLS